jgi:hypothetical protein
MITGNSGTTEFEKVAAQSPIRGTFVARYTKIVTSKYGNVFGASGKPSRVGGGYFVFDLHAAPRRRPCRCGASPARGERQKWAKRQPTRRRRGRSGGSAIVAPTRASRYGRGSATSSLSTYVPRPQGGRVWRGALPAGRGAARTECHHNLQAAPSEQESQERSHRTMDGIKPGRPERPAHVRRP